MDSKEEKPLEVQEPGQEKRHVQEVIRVAKIELRDLLLKRSEIMHRIGSIKRTILGLATVFGDSGGNQEWDDEWLDLRSRKDNSGRPGFTKTCRLILMEAEGPLTAREVCARVKGKLEQFELRHKDPLASVTTVLNRLAEYGEARIVPIENGRRAWQWVGESVPTDAQKTMERTLAESSPHSKT